MKNNKPNKLTTIIIKKSILKKMYEYPNKS